MTKEEVLEIANAAAAAAVAPVRAEAEEEKKKVAALQAENATLKTANADLKASMEGTAQVVAQNAAEKGLAKLLAVAEGENDGPVLIAPKGEVAAAHRKAITALYATDPKAAEAYVASLKPIAKGTRVVSAGAPNAGSRASAPAFPFDLYHGTSTDAAYQEMVAWGAEQMAAGTNFANATEWINAYDRANPRRAEVA